MERYRITTTTTHIHTYVHTYIYPKSKSLSLLCRIGSEGEVGRGIWGEVGRGGEERYGKVRCLNIQQQQHNSFRYVYTTKGPKNQSIGSLFHLLSRTGQDRVEQSREG